MLIDPTFVGDLETNMQLIMMDTYSGLLQYMWWQDLVYVNPSDALKEVFYFALEQAQLHDGGQGGFKTFDELQYLNTYGLNTYTQSALELTEAQLSDIDGRGVDAAAQWVREITKLCMYHPQWKLAQAILANANTYDGLSFFNTGHFLNGLNANNGTFANLFTSAAIDGSGYRIDRVVPINIARDGLNNAIAAIRQIKTPTGYPRNLQPKVLLVPPALWGRAVDLTQAKSIPMAATGGAAAVDNEPFLQFAGLGRPVVAPELGAAYSGGSDTSYYIIADFAGPAAPWIYNNRLPFSVKMHSGMTDVELDRADKLQWICKGRNSTMPLHPFAMFKFTIA